MSTPLGKAKHDADERQAQADDASRKAHLAAQLKGAAGQCCGCGNGCGGWRRR